MIRRRGLAGLLAGALLLAAVWLARARPGPRPRAVVDALEAEAAETASSG